MITKPATATAWVAERCAEILVDSGALPDGAFQMIVGGTGDLLDRLGPQDVFAFTGSADTARKLLAGDAMRAPIHRTNVEADSLNASVLGPDAARGGDTFDRFVRDIAHEMMQKAGQKCTAIRRVFVPVERIDAVQDALIARLEKKAVVGNPADEAVTVGPLATASQLADAERGVRELESAGARKVYGEGRRVDGVGSPEDQRLLLSADPAAPRRRARAPGSSTSARSSRPSRPSCPTTAPPPTRRSSWHSAAARW